MEGAISQVEIWASPERPTTAQIGGVDSEDFFKNIGPYQCQLFLADDRNTRLGQVGGWGGMNHYEGCIVYNFNNKTYYFPGGTDRVYEDKNTVLYIFRTMAGCSGGKNLHPAQKRGTRQLRNPLTNNDHLSLC